MEVFFVSTPALVMQRLFSCSSRKQCSPTLHCVLSLYSSADLSIFQCKIHYEHPFCSCAPFLKENPFGYRNKRKGFPAYFFSSPLPTSSISRFQYIDCGIFYLSNHYLSLENLQFRKRISYVEYETKIRGRKWYMPYKKVKIQCSSKCEGVTLSVFASTIVKEDNEVHFELNIERCQKEFSLLGKVKHLFSHPTVYFCELSS